MAGDMKPEERDDDMFRDHRDERDEGAGGGEGGDSPPRVDQPIVQIVPVITLVMPPTSETSVASISPNTVTAASNTSTSAPTKSSQTDPGSPTTATTTKRASAATPPETTTPAITTPQTTTPATPATQTPPPTTTEKPPQPAKQAYPLLCTVGAISKSTSLPTDGVCGVLFYGSLHKLGLNNLTAGLGADVSQFISLTSHYASTALGVSFDISPEEIDTEYVRPEFDIGVDSLWQQRIAHFGALNTHVDNASITYIGKVLEMLKNTSIELLRKISATAAQPMLALSFTMQGRYYTPVNPNPRTSRLGNFDVFKPCARNHDNQAVAPAEACKDQLTAAAASYRYRAAFYASLAYNKATNITLTFDSERALQSKVCASKGNAVTLRYGIAVYDVEDDGSPGECSRFTLRGQYCRLCMLRRLHDFISANYTGARLDKAACYKINPEMTDDSGSKCA